MHVPGGARTINPRGRFERLEVALEEEAEHEAGRPRTIYLRDDSQSIISTNDSPDIGFRSSINPYRGCEHGCSYCYARPYHEYLGFSAGQDFETKIMVKPDAARLLRKALSSPKWQPEVLAISGVTDCYQPVERKLEITRQCLEVLAEFRNPCVIVTKNHLVTRDIDHLRELAAYQAAMVFVSVTTLDTDLASALEPRAATRPTGSMPSGNCECGNTGWCIDGTRHSGTERTRNPGHSQSGEGGRGGDGWLYGDPATLWSEGRLCRVARNASPGFKGEDPRPHSRHDGWSA